MASIESRLKKIKNGTAKWTDEDTSTAARLRRAAAKAGITDEKLKEQLEERNAERRTQEAAKKREQESGGDWWEDTKNFVGNVVDEGTKAYKRLPKGVSNVIGEVTGDNDRIRENQRKAQEDEFNLIKRAQQKLKDPNVSEEEKARWRNTVKKTTERSTSFKEADEYNTKLQEENDPVKGAADVGRIGVDILSGGTLSALRAAKGAKAGAAGLSLGTKGIRTGKLSRGADDLTMGTGKRIARQGAAGAALEGGYSPLGQLAEDGEITLEDTLADATFGAALGGAAGAVDGALTRGARKGAKAKQLAADEDVASVGQGIPDLEREMALEQRALDDMAGRLDPNGPKLLGSGEDTARTRLEEIKALKEAQRGGDIENTSFTGAEPSPSDMEGRVGVTANSAEVDEVRARVDEELTPLQQQIDELETIKSEIVDERRYNESLKNLDIEFQEFMKKVERIKSVTGKQHALDTVGRDFQAREEAIHDKFLNQDGHIAEADAKIAELRAQEDEIAQRGMDEIAEIESRQAAIQSERQARVKNMTADDWRAMNQEEKELEAQLADIEYSKTLEVSNETGTPITELAKENPAVENKVMNSLADSAAEFDGYNEGATVGPFLGNLATTEITMRQAGPAVAKTWDEKIVPGQQRRDFALNEDIKQLEQLAKGIAGDRERGTKIFQALDTGDFSTLDAQELAAADWFRGNFKRLAQEIGLPEEQRLSSYVTHLFQGKGAEKLLEAQRILASGKTKGGKALTKEQEKKYRAIIYQSDPELLRLMQKNASGKVNDNYLKKRKGVEGYETDPFQAYMVYAKKAYTKIHLEEGLTELAEHKDLVSDSYRKYINKTINRIKGVPDKDLQEQINNGIMKLTGGRLDAGSFEKGTRKTSQAIYRGTLQYNFGTALTNLQQMGNTFTEVGTTHLLKGVADAMGAIKSGNMQELHKMGVLEGSLSEALINDQSLLKSMVGKGLEKSDKVGWYMFQTVEEMNRATAYYAAKSKATGKLKMPEKEAQQYAARIARKTQFKFSEIDTPPALHGPIAKNLTQLLTFSVKQTEYLKRTLISEEGMFVPTSGGKFKLSKEGAARVGRLLLGYTVIGGTVGQITGIGNIDYGDIAEGDFGSLGNVVTENTPFYQNFTEGELPSSPLVSFIKGNKRGVGLANILSGKNEYDRETSRWDIAKEVAFEKAPGLFVPGGTQIKKTTEGLRAGEKGYSESGPWYDPNAEGRVRFEVDGGYDKGMAAIFGQYNTSGGRDYIKGGLNSLSEPESRTYESASPAKREMYMTFFKANDNFAEMVKKEFKDKKKKGIKGGKQGLSDEITRLIREDKNPEKARRYADDWNAIVEEAYAPVKEQFKGMIPQELEDKIEEQKISSTPKAFERRRKKK